jgi:hypothetical protein
VRVQIVAVGKVKETGIREAIESRRWAEAQAYLGLVARTLDGYSSRLEQTTTALPVK